MQQLNFLEILESPQFVCPVCKKIFEKTNIPHKKYCSVKCQHKGYYTENKEMVLRKCKERYKKYKGKKVKINKRKCKSCKKDFKTNRFWQWFCSYECQNRNHARLYRKNNKEKWRENNRKYQKTYSDKNRNVKNLKNSIHTRIINNSKNTPERIFEHLGCTIQDARNHIQSLFKEGMTWENYGRYGWHIDHIIPVSYFDTNDKEQLKKCFHYTNLQPLWWYENMTKGTKIIGNIIDNTNLIHCSTIGYTIPI